MNIFKRTILITSLTFSTQIFADINTHSEAHKEAAILLEASGTEKMMSQTAEQMLQVQLQQNPTLAPYKEIMLKFINKHMSYNSIKSELINLYAESFTAEELRDLTNFYKTPTGQKAIIKMPELMARGAQIGAMRVQSNITELQEMIKQESERLQLLKVE